MDDIVVSTGERIELIWQYIANSFWDIRIEFEFLFDFVCEHEICWNILVCFLISASVIILKRLTAVIGH